jgi:hypothetical protein
MNAGGPTARVAALVVAAVLLVVACGPAQSAEPTGGASGPATLGPPSAGASGSPGPSAGATAIASAPPAPVLAIQPNIAVRVTVATLNVRALPSTTASKAGSLAKGDVVALLGYGAVHAGGYTWFEAARIKGLHGPLPALPTYPLEGGSWTDLTGWIAVSKGSTPYVAALPARCPAGAPDLAMLSAMLLGEQLACFGTTPLVFDGTIGCGGCGGAYPGIFEPAWLAAPLAELISVKPEARIGPLQLYFPPDVSHPAAGTILRVHAHLGDPRSSTCSIAPVIGEGIDAPPVPLSAADAATYCRQHLVVDSVEVLGVDPSFPLG